LAEIREGLAALAWRKRKRFAMIELEKSKKFMERIFRS